MNLKQIPIGLLEHIMIVVECSGYMSPDYAMESLFLEKSDVYSFGVLMLEIVSGRKNSSFYHHDRPVNLIGYKHCVGSILKTLPCF
ncbi:hypothetical protein CsSME_00041523 [Camellia sinensis var. sinensis]